MTTPEALPLTASEIRSASELAETDYVWSPTWAKRALATIAAEKARADEAEAQVAWQKGANEFLTISKIEEVNTERDERIATLQSDNATLSAKLAVCVEAVVEACANECNLRDEAKRIMSPDVERYAEAAHSLANLKAQILAITDGTVEAILTARPGA